MVSFIHRRRKVGPDYFDARNQEQQAQARRSIQERLDSLYAKAGEIGSLVGYYYISRGLRFAWKQFEAETDDYRYGVTLVDNHWLLLGHGGRPTAIYVDKISKDESDITMAQVRLSDSLFVTPDVLENTLANAYAARLLLHEVELVVGLKNSNLE